MVYYNSTASISCPEYLELSYTGVLKEVGRRQSGRGILVALGDSSSGSQYYLQIKRGYTNGLPTDKRSLSLSYGASGTLRDLIVTDFEPSHDQMYEVGAVRQSGRWTLYVGGLEQGTAADPLSLTHLDPVWLGTVGCVTWMTLQS